MTHAIIYDRASTKMQENNYSRVNAKDVGIKIAEQHGYTWEYRKEIGSGTSLVRRPVMKEVLDRIESGEVQAIIVQDLDRLARPTSRSVYESMREIFLEHNVIVHTHTGIYDFADDDSDFVADISMAVAKKESRRIRKRMTRGRKAKAEQGGFIGGRPALGYKVHYTSNGGQKPLSELIIDENERSVIGTVFDVVEKLGGNINGATKKLNTEGFKTKIGVLFSPNAVRKIVTNRLYTGLVEWTSLTDKSVFRPELQIITIKQFDRVQQLLKRRKRAPLNQGGRGKYLFTGFVVCGGCGGPMVAANMKVGNVYRPIYCCVNQRKHGKVACPHSKTYSEKLIVEAITVTLTGVIQNQIGLIKLLNDAAEQYGKTVSEETLEAKAIHELALIKREKDRLIDAISKGIIYDGEVQDKLVALREQEQAINLELAGISEKSSIRADYLHTIESLKNADIQTELTLMARNQPIVFRRLLALIFEPNSLRVRSERVAGRKWQTIIEGYKFTKAIEQMNRHNILSNCTEL